MKQLYMFLRSNLNEYENIKVFENFIESLSAEEKEILIH